MPKEKSREEFMIIGELRTRLVHRWITAHHGNNGDTRIFRLARRILGWERNAKQSSDSAYAFCMGENWREQLAIDKAAIGNDLIDAALSGELPAIDKALKNLKADEVHSPNQVNVLRAYESFCTEHGKLPTVPDIYSKMKSDIAANLIPSIRGVTDIIERLDLPISKGIRGRKPINRK
ncbi:MAG: hypothetical protein ABIT76_09560 [Chthoniobacterales bacterium]